MQFKKVVTFMLAPIVAAGLAFGEASTALMAVNDLDVRSIQADVVNADQFVFAYSEYTMHGTVVSTSPTYTNTVTSYGSSGQLVVSTNVTGGQVVTNTDKITGAMFYGKSGVRVINPNTVSRQLTLDKPGILVPRVSSARSQVYQAAWSNGVFVTYTNTITGATNSVPAATLGQTFAIINGGVSNFVFSTGTTVLPNSTVYTQAPNSAILLTPVSATSWKILANQ
jgi:hypothetical protein